MRKLPQQSGYAKQADANTHESAQKHVTGQAIYIDDMPEPQGLLHAAIGCSSVAYAELKHCDLQAVKTQSGVQAVIQAEDIPGKLDIGPVFPGDLLFAQNQVTHHGQAIFAVAADTFEQAHRARAYAKIDYDEKTPLLTIESALAQARFVRPSHTQRRGDAKETFEKSSHQLTGQVSIQGQEHFYLEGQIALAQPTEDGMKIYASTQHPAEIQKLVAQVLNVALNRIQVEVRRMGGGFGGKETQAAFVACIAAALAAKTQRPVKLRLPRNQDMVMTGKRHDFKADYQVSTNQAGIITSAQINLAARCGISPDLSDAIVDRAMFHVDNAYYLGDVEVTGHRCFTNTVSATAFRGFGGPQGMAISEAMIDRIARHCQLDPLTVRQKNLYQAPDKQVTHYGQTVEDFPLADIIEELATTAKYWQRREAITAFNKKEKFLKKGIALTPVKFGISFTASFLNQAGALVHVYTDGSVQVNHGGTEMGQGLHTKIAQIAAATFQVDVSRIVITATATDKVPNTSPTAASAGTDLNGQATQNACLTIKKRLCEFIAETYLVSEAEIEFTNNQIHFGTQTLSFTDLVQQAYLARISLSATGYYRTPEIYYDRDNATGNPFYYYACGAAVSEVIIDVLTGESRVLAVDILHDVGQSLNPAIDIGQIEGGFVQGMGWVTTEDCHWDETGRLSSNSPANYKIPTADDVPKHFNVTLYTKAPNQKATIGRSKAVGEPPLMLALSVWSAIQDAVSSTVNYQLSPELALPATPEAILRAIQTTQAKHHD